MKKMIVLTITSFWFSSCYNDNAEDMYQNFPQDCDVAAVSFLQDVQPIINNNCVGCHGSVSPSAGLSLITYDQIKNASAKINTRINLPQGNALRMPPGGMPQCNINKINAWIAQGALNN